MEYNRPTTIDPQIKNIIFDFGGVLIDWNPRYLYRSYFQTEEEMEYFLTHICTDEWNAQQDAGRPFAEGVALLQAEHPEYAEAIALYRTRWSEMIAGAIQENVAWLRELKSQGYHIYGLTNWSAETLPGVIAQYDFFGLMDGIVMSGEEHLLKPDIRIYQTLLDRYHLRADECLFIDDSLANIEGAKQAGLAVWHLTRRPIKALFVDGGPRKNKNTAQALQSAMQGAQDAGAEVELIHLYDIDLKGCKSCFACQLKNAKTDGVCVIKDELRPVLEKAHEADVIVIGSPVYFSYPTGATRSFMERLLFPNFTYDYDEQGNRRRPIDEKQTAMIFTMNVPEKALDEWKYPTLLGTCADTLRENFGHSDTLYICDTYQFQDYSRYAMTVFKEEDKRRHRDEHFPIDMQRAYNLGKRLAEAGKRMAEKIF